MDFHFFCFFLFFFFFCSKGVVAGGIELELIHRDSPFSPLYNSSATSGERARDAALRSLASLSNEASVESTIYPGLGDYLVEFYIGTPPTKISVIMDTGSDLIWTQCAPCISCYHQDRPLYDSTKSSTYTSVLCDEPLCRQTLSESNCSSSSNCNYSTLYADGSTSRGKLATEKFNFPRVDGGHVVATSTRLVFGCGQENNLLFSGGGSSGILGLGAGILSLISQLGPDTERRFSYCLPKTEDYTGNLKLGLNAGISGGLEVSTPLITDEIHPNYYYVSLEGITVGKNGKKIAYKQASSGKGNTIVDSGSTLNYIDPELYYDLISTLKKVIGLQTVEDPELYYSLCYSKETFSKIPEQTVIFHFSGADVELKNINMFMPVHNMMCFSMASSQRVSYNLYGNIAQKDFQVEYDLERKVLSFSPANCSQNLSKGAGARSYSHPLVSTFVCITLIFVHVFNLKL